MAKEKTTSSLPAATVTTLGRATRAENDEQLLDSWLANLTSAHSRRNFKVTPRRFLAELPAGGLRAATIEDVRNALSRITVGVAETTGRQYVLRVKSLLGDAQRLGYAPFNAGATIRVRSDARNRGATLAKRIISEVDVALIVCGARTKRERVLMQVLYAGGPRVSEVAGLTWADVLMRDKGQVQLSITGKGGIVRQVLLPGAVSRSLLSLRRRRRQRRGVRLPQDGCPAERAGDPGPRQARRRACRPNLAAVGLDVHPSTGAPSEMIEASLATWCWSVGASPQ
jgi:integrase